MQRKIAKSLILVTILALCFVFLHAENNDPEFSYELNSDGNTYAVTGIGNKKVSVLEIPAVYNDKAVTTIGYRAFEDNYNIKSVYMPDTILFIDEFAFSGCHNLKNVSISSSLKTISKSAFYDCTGLSDISFPSSLSSIGDWAFYNCISLKEIAFSKNLKSFGIGSFSFCRGLTKVSLPDSITSLPMYCFSDCSGLAEIEIPFQLVSIGEYAFADCNKLKDMTLTNTALKINGSAFYGDSFTVHYPCDDVTWDKYNKTGYGGNVTWQKHLNLEHFDAKSPTESEAGNVEYWYCKDCKSYFKDITSLEKVEYKEVLLPALKVIRGDVNGDAVVDEDDVILSLYHLLFNDKYEVNQNIDFNGSGVENEDDVIQLLYHILFGDKYPIR